MNATNPMNTPSPQTLEQITHVKKYRAARYSLLLVIVFSLVNVFSVAFAQTYFLFSSYVTQIIIFEGVGMYLELANIAYLAVTFIFAVVSVLPYFVFWLLSGKRRGFMVAALVLFSLDTLLLVIDIPAYIAAGDMSFLIDGLLHAYVLWSIADGVKHAKGALAPVAPSHVGFAPAANDPFAEPDPNAAIMRRVTVSRKKGFAASLSRMSCLIDGQCVGMLKNGESATYTVTGTAHELVLLYDNQNGGSAGVVIPAGDRDISYLATTKSAFSGVKIVIEEAR